MILDAINELIEYESLVFNYSFVDKIYYRNLVLSELNIECPPKVFECDDEENVQHLRLPDSILDEIKEYLFNELLLNESEAEIKLTKIMGLITPPNSVIEHEFKKLEKEDPKKALQYFYDFSIRNNYIQKSKVEKNLLWKSNFEDKNIEVSINLSKPEKNIKDIIKAADKKTNAGEKYPKCQLCLENVGFIGNANHPSRVNLRVIPLTLDGEEWYLQYSPYGYFNKHCIAFSKNHNNMVINTSTFKKLCDFVDRFPSFFIGSNADLPIVGGSILSHEHFQGGEHLLPVMKADVKREYELGQEYKETKLFLLDWYNSTLLVKSKSKVELVNLATHILNKWKNYSDDTNDIIAIDKDGPHNTITPSLKKVDGVYHLYLILRNNRTSYKYPEGIFHAHPRYYHIKKENIGIIEAMGLFILPARLVRQTGAIKECLAKGMSNEEIFKKYEDLAGFSIMIDELRKDYSPETIDESIKNYINNVCKNILENTSVFKATEKGEYGIDTFLRSCL